MLFFTVKQDFVLNMNNSQISLKFEYPRARSENAGDLELSYIYASSLVDIQLIKSYGEDVLTILDGDKIYPILEAKEIGTPYQDQFKQIITDNDYRFSSSFVPLYDQLKDVSKRSIKIAFIGCFGGGIGDLICAIPAFRVWVKALQAHFDKVHIDIFSHGCIDTLFKHSVYFFTGEIGVNHIYSLPLSLEQLNGYDAFVDTSFFMQDRQAGLLNIVDFALYKLGIDYQSIDADDKRLQLSPPYEIEHLFERYIKQLAGDKKVVLFHPRSSTIYRSIPKELQYMLLNMVLDDEGVIVISVNDLKDYQHERFIDLSHLSLSLDHFFSVIAHSDYCISCDSALYHIAHSFNKPCIVFFTTIHPKLRTKYYNHIYPIYVGDEGISHFHNQTYNTQAEEMDIEQRFKDMDITLFLNHLRKIRAL